MKPKFVISNYSLLIGLIGLAPSVSFGAVRVGNLSRNYADAYNQTNNKYAQMGTVPQTNISAGDATARAAAITDSAATPVMATPSQMEQCTRIYPDGQFAWDMPNAGTVVGGDKTCVAVVELRTIDSNGSYVTLARANVRAGDAVRCNISDFPESGYTNDVGSFVFPADSEPTVDDVVKVMDQEQKQNAGLKIAAGALIGGIGGNLAGKNEVGHDGLLGTGKAKMTSSAIGAVAGAAIGAGSAYTGKVAGDVILSTGVNAAAGGVMGNMMASGDSVLRIEDCEIKGVKTSCLWGFITTGKELAEGKTAFLNISDGVTTVVCDAVAGSTQQWKDCSPQSLTSITIDNQSLESIQTTHFETLRNDTSKQFHYGKDVRGNKIMESGAPSAGDLNNPDIFVQISSASTVDRRIAAMVPDVKDKTFGMKKSDWTKWRREHPKAEIWGRGANGTAYDLKTGNAASASKSATGKDAGKEDESKTTATGGDALGDDVTYSINDFEPMMISADDGGIIDLSNKARMKSTMIGAGAGGAMGAFVGYQGAQSDIDERWVSAVREYKDSLTKFYCQTGSRYLTSYNDTVIIPAMSE